MGAWGYKVFENDDAGDWVYELEESDDYSAIESALSPDGQDYLEAPDGCMILAASEVLLGLRGIQRGYFPDEVKSWVENHREGDFDGLIPAAIRMVERVLAPQSELRDLFKENEELYPLWKADTEDLLTKLKG